MAWRITVDYNGYVKDYEDTEGTVYETYDLHEAVDMFRSVKDRIKGKVDLREVNSKW